MSSPNKNRKLVLKGLAGLGFSCFLVWAFVRRVDSTALSEAFSEMRVGWFGFAVALFGLGIAISGARWRISLVMNSLSEPLGFVLRVSCVAHCFNVLLMGPFGGDVAKAAFFSRWRRRSGAEVIATCAIDRILAAGGSVIYGLLAVVFVVWFGGAERMRGLHVSTSGWTSAIIVAAFLIVIVWLVRGRLVGNAFLVDSWYSFCRGMQRFRDSPKMVALAIFLSFLSEVLWSSILAVCLFSVVGKGIDWERVLWVFPVVSAVASLPISIGGAGVREGIAVFLLSICEVDGADALASALLTSSVYVLWVLIGAVVGWREERCFASSREIARNC